MWMQINWTEGTRLGAGFLLIDGKAYVLQQCHWHSPAEHKFLGRRYLLYHSISSLYFSPINLPWGGWHWVARGRDIGCLEGGTTRIWGFFEIGFVHFKNNFDITWKCHSTSHLVQCILIVPLNSSLWN